MPFFGCGPTAQQGCVLAFGLELLHACADFLCAFNMEIRQRSAAAYCVDANTVHRIFTRQGPGQSQLYGLGGILQGHDFDGVCLSEWPPERPDVAEVAQALQTLRLGRS